MSNIAEHHTEQEWENRDGIKGWVDLLVARDTVGVDDLLEGGGEGVGLDVGWVF